MKPELSIIVPCLNEEGAIPVCISQIKKTIRDNGLDAEVIFVNNASTDKSEQIIQNEKFSFPELRIAFEPHQGYGSAYLKGFEESRGKYIFMADCDGTYDFGEIPHFLEKLRAGADLVVGNRFHKKLEESAMPWHHRYIGNPILSFITRLFFKLKINDIHCGSRAIKRDALNRIVLYTRGMEFASEMIIKCVRQKMNIVEIPVSYNTRIGISKLNSFSDGWRHLRFLLLYSPLFLFMIPGFLLFLTGCISMFVLYFFNLKILGIQLYIHPMFLSSMLILAGYQLIFFAGFAKVYAVTHLGDNDETIKNLFKHITIEKAGLLGIVAIIAGMVIYSLIFIKWIDSGFGSLYEIKNSIIALTMIILGLQTFFSAFMFSILGIKEK